MNATPREENSVASVLHSAWIRSPIVLERASGCTLWDTEGHTYLDLLSSNMGPAMVGHSHPAVVSAIQAQVERLMSTRILFDNVPLIRYCERIAGLAPFDEAKTYLAPGGGEANEAAVKLAMLLTGRDGVVSLEGSYHGQSIGTMSMCGYPGLRERVPNGLRLDSFRRVIPGHAYRPWEEASGMTWQESLAELEADLKRSPDVAAFIIEPIQAVAGHVVFEDEFLREVQRICSEYGILLIADEVQTAMGRCGTPWASIQYGLKPDIITIGKGLGGGMPFGAMIVRGALVNDAMESAPWHLLTAQQHPVQAAAGLAVIDVIESEGLIERSRSLGELATERFNALADRYEVIGDVRSPGLFIGVDLVADRASMTPLTAVCQEAWEFALSIGILTEFAGVGGNVLKFKPPLTVSDEDLERMLDGCDRIIAFVDRNARESHSASA